MARKLVIVESPAKARSLAGFLGPEYTVEASIGHIRDLPQPSDLPAEMKKGPYGKFAVDVEGDFDPYYVVYPDKKRRVTELRKLLKDADELYLATDEDREGEAIAWHLLEVLKPKVPVKRMVFHEITKEAIDEAVRNPRELDTALVDAQETRRILDRLVGYEISPLLWRKIKPGLSAGRVQSVATRMVVERERERIAFRSANYWDVTATFEKARESFDARLATVDGARVATGRDFGDDGILTSQALALDEATATALAKSVLTGTVSSLETKPYTRRPAAPFTTSTLQQEASRKLRMSVAETMRVAQALYENGYITYMRTDSTALSSQALEAARGQAAELFGAESVPGRPRLYGKVSKGAQEAHEAIRPAGERFRRPSEAGLHGAQAKLYDLIWKRTIASQMTDATGHTATVRLASEVVLAESDGATLLGPGVHELLFTASGTVITHRGFLAAYEEGRDATQHQENGRPREGAGAKETRLPPMETGDVLDATNVTAAGHDTAPPPRYTEASLVKAMEERGIGRPSTYAATIATIMDRGYVSKRGQALVPSWLAFSVTRLLEQNLARFVDYDFTAGMEQQLDDIARGDLDRVQWLREFYHGESDSLGLRGQVEGLGDIDARAVNSQDLGEGITLRVGRYGPYLETPGENGDPRRASIPDDVAPDELTLEKARELMESRVDEARELGTDPETGRTIAVRNGRFGPYVTEVLPEDAPKKAKPRTASLFKDMQLETVELEDALKLLSLPRIVGTDAEGTEITAQNGRYGPYLKKGTDSRSLTTEEQIFTVTLEEAEELFAQPKQRRGAGGRAASSARVLGEDPATGAKVTVREGRWGPYVTDGTTNATLRTGDEPATITPERAFDLLAEKRAKGPTPKRGSRGGTGTTAKKPASTRTAAKKPAAKKPAAEKPAAEKPAAEKPAAEEPAAEKPAAED
ncbi:MAG TPA: type I DNA topoisomerase [Actinomycetaceae bacterium]|nr:type I DNA topoisomerase [Actinomycetaceae bacterium]